MESPCCKPRSRGRKPRQWFPLAAVGKTPVGFGGGLLRVPWAIGVILASMPSQDPIMVPLQGLGEMGMHSFAIGQGGSWVLVDLGARFSSGDSRPQVPEPILSWLCSLGGQLRGIVLTHGHRDHIGGVADLLDRLSPTGQGERTSGDVDAPGPTVYGSRWTLTLTRRLCEQRGVKHRSWKIVAPGDRWVVDRLAFTALPVEHSIPGAHALLMEAGAMRIVHTGDFSGHDHQQETWQAVLRKPTDYLLSDSTNATRQDDRMTEAQVLAHMGRAAETVQGAVLATTFASHVERIRGMLEIAERLGRRVFLLGRSLREQVTLALEQGHLPGRFRTCLQQASARHMPPHRLWIVASGSQGDVEGNCRRLGLGDHPHYVPKEGDGFIYSARVIPGYEPAVQAMWQSFEERGVTLFSEVTGHAVHTSGHAYPRAQRAMIRDVAPAHFIAVHGTGAHLEAHAALAETGRGLESDGVPAVHRVYTGAPMAFTPRGPVPVAVQPPFPPVCCPQGTPHP